MRGLATIAALAVPLWLAGAAAAADAGAPALLEVYPSTARFDLANGRLIESARPGGPKDAAALRLDAEPLQLRAVKDEVVSFQIVVRGAPGTLKAGLEPVMRSGVGGALATATATTGLPHAELFAERGVKITAPSTPYYVVSLGPGLYPDILVPTSTVVVPPAPGVGVLWIDVFVPRNVAAGAYRGAVTVDTRGRVPFELEVLDFALPEADLTGLGTVNFGSFLELERRDPARMRSWMQLAHAHHVSVEIMRLAPVVGPGVAIDWDGWARRIGPYVDGSAFSRAAGYRGPREGLPATRFMLPQTDGWPVPAKDRLPSDPVAWSRSLKDWESFAEARGWLGRTHPTRWILFINSLDEPKSAEALEHIKRYGPLIDDAKLTDRRRVVFRTDGPFGQKTTGWSDAKILEELGGVVDLWNVCGAPSWSPWFLLEHRRFADPTEGVMFYASNTAGEPAIPPLVVDSALPGARAWAWIIRRYELAGALNWEINLQAGCVENPRCSPGGEMNLDATLIYRGEEVGRATDEPIPSMRLKTLRRGAQDIGLVSLLFEKDANTARAIVDIMIPRAMGDDQKDNTPGMWPVDPMSYERARDTILSRLAPPRPGSGTSAPEPMPSMAISEIRPEVPSDPIHRSRWTWLLAAGLLAAAFLFLRSMRRGGGRGT